MIEKEPSGSQRSLSLKKQAFVSNISETSSNSNSDKDYDEVQELNIDDDNNEDGQGHTAISRSSSQLSEPKVQEFEGNLIVDQQQSCSNFQWNDKDRSI